MNYVTPTSGDAAYSINTVTQNGSSIYSLSRRMYERFLQVYDTVFPINIATNRREFGYLPKFASKTLENIATDLYQIAHTYRHRNEEMEDRLGKIFDSIFLHVSNKQINRPLIVDSKKCAAEDPYLTKQLPGSDALSLFGGRLIISKEFIENVDAWDYSKEGKVTKEDVLAAALGHEIAHLEIGHPGKRTAQNIAIKVIVYPLLSSMYCTTASLATFNAIKLFLVHSTFSRIKDLVDKKIAGETIFYLLLSAIYYTGTPLFLVDAVKLFPLCASFFWIMDLRGSHKAEREADEYGIELMHKARYNMEGALTLQKICKNSFEKNPKTTPQMKKMMDSGVTGHPSYESRIKANKETIQKIALRKLAFACVESEKGVF